VNDFTKNYKPDFPISAYIRSIIATALVFLLLAIVMLLLIPLIIVSLGKLKNFLIKHVGAALGIISLLFYGVKIEYDYSLYKPDIPAVYISNHSSTLDLFAIISMKLPNVRYVAKKEIQYNPLFFVIGNLTGQIFIDRKQSKRTITQLKKLYKKIKSEKLSLFIAPEGTRKHTEIVGPFKKGAFHIAHDLKYPIVPVYVDGAYALCPVSSMITMPGVITLRYFPPVEVSGWDEKRMNMEIERFREFYKDQYKKTFLERGIPFDA